MVLRFVSASAQHRLSIASYRYAAQSKGERRGEQRMWGTPEGVRLRLEQAGLLFSQLEEDR